MPKLEQSLNLTWQKINEEIIISEPTSVIGGIGSYKIDLAAKCGFSCLYCSSNCSRLMLENRSNIIKWSHDQFNKKLDPLKNSYKFGIYYQNPIESLIHQLKKQPNLRKLKSTLQFGILTDGFDPYLLRSGITYKALNILLQSTMFNIRILTKSAAVGNSEFIELFKKFKTRVKVGISCSSLDNNLMKKIELRTSMPSARIKALQKLQKSKISTFGMFCPIFPGQESVKDLIKLYKAFNPSNLEEIWVEPYTEQNWHYFYRYIEDKALKSKIKSIMSDENKWADYVEKLAKNHSTAINLLNFKGRSKVLVYAPSLTNRQISALERRKILFQ